MLLALFVAAQIRGEVLLVVIAEHGGDAGARALAREFANDNIRVNCISPGLERVKGHI